MVGEYSVGKMGDYTRDIGRYLITFARVRNIHTSQEDHRHGFGTHKWKDGRVFQGEFCQDRFVAEIEGPPFEYFVV